RTRSHDHAHRQVLLRPQRHLLAGGEGGFQQLSGPCGPHRERGIALRHHRAGLHPAQPVLGFPCNQFGYQENCTNEEILNSLKYVRPGGGFEPNFTLFQKCQVNGQDTHPVFAYLKAHLPAPADDTVHLMAEPRFVVWSPVRRADISWNFEKFLVGPEGEPFRRYSPRMPTAQLEPDIQRLLKLAK
uniref:Glutathione peroxidase n=1 Tax=Dromaius novaehollandiae TaxID=8790 RepID=A0A8C4JI59_DRONO